MNTLKFFMVFLFLVVMLSSVENVNAGGMQPFYYVCNGQLTTDNTCGSGSFQMGKPFMATDANGRPVQMVCDWADRLTSGVAGGVLADAGAWATNRMYNLNNRGAGVKVVDQTAAFIAGAIAGSTVACRPTSGSFIHDLIDDKQPALQQQTTAQPQQQTSSRSTSRTYTVDMCRNNRTGEIVGPAASGSDPCGQYRSGRSSTQQQNAQQNESRTVAYLRAPTTYRNNIVSQSECVGKGWNWLGDGVCMTN